VSGRTGLALGIALVLLVVGAAPATAHHRDADQTTRIAALETRVAALEARLAALVAPTATTAPSPTTAQTPPPSAAPCPTSLQAAIDATPAGGTLDVTGCTFTGSFRISRSIELAGARFLDSAWTLVVRASGVVLRDLVFERQRETSIRFEGAGTSATVERVRIVQTVDTGSTYSPISGACPGCRMRDITIRDSWIDQGPDGIAHGGIEVWDTDRLVIERNELRGAGFALVSVPRSDGAIVRDNRFVLTDALWGIEAADVDNVVVSGNIVTGPNRYQRDGMAFVQLHPGSGQVLRASITRNTVSDVWALLNAAGSDHVITDNCTAGLTKLYAYSFSGLVTIARNGPCAP